MKNTILLLILIFVHQFSSAQWSQITSPYSGNLWCITFADNSLGFSGGNTAMLTTTNSGINWTSSNTASVFSINDLSFPTYDTGYYAANNTTVGKTVDHGQTWTTLNLGLSPWPITAVYFVNASIGYIGAGDGSVHKTVNGGTSWSPQTTSLNLSDVKEIHFFDEMNGVLVAEDGKIRKTINGGVQWSIVSSGTTGNLYDLYFVNNSIGYICGASGKILKSTDGGSSWSPLTSGTTQYLYTICFKDPLDGYTGGANGTLLHTIDGGTTWTPVTSSTPGGINDMAYINGRYIAVCDAGKIITDIATGIENIRHSVFSSVFPNPSTTQININLDKHYSQITLKVFDAQGKEVYERVLTDKSNIDIITSELKPGLYFYHLILDKNSESTGRWVVE